MSKTPDVLASYLQNCETLWYDDELQKIRLSSEAEDSEVGLKELADLFSLLIQKPFYLIQIDLEVMKNKPI